MSGANTTLKMPLPDEALAGPSGTIKQHPRPTAATAGQSFSYRLEATTWYRVQ